MLIPVIGLEIHCELQTNSKVFCTCENTFGGDTNIRVCPTCMGLPGTLPVLNQKAVEYSVRAGMALGCRINQHSEFDRKNYFYPDLPKAYQISQLYEPLCVDGGFEIAGKDGKGKFIRINRIHLEEDAGKLVHDDLLELSLADYNRCGVPLIEIVTEPDLSSPEEAAEFVRKVSLLLRYAGVSDCRMEQGSLRVDVNISLKEEQAEELGTRAEIKNLNSVRSVVRAIEWEIKRQTDLLESGGRVVQETRSFKESTGQTRSLRSKEDAHDYRYFKDPDIQPVMLTPDDLERIEKDLPIMPDVRFKRYTRDFELSDIDAQNLVENKAVSDFYEAALEEFYAPKLTASCILVDIFRLIKDSEEDAVIPFPPAHLAYLLEEQDEGKIGKADCKAVLREMFATRQHPKKIIRAKGLGIQNDMEEITASILEVLSAQPKAVNEYKEGKTKVFGFLMGQCNQLLKGKASPSLLKTELEKALSR